MGKFNSNKVIRGTSGRAWVDGDLMANIRFSFGNEEKTKTAF